MPLLGLVLNLSHFGIFVPGSTPMIYMFPTDGVPLGSFMRTVESKEIADTFYN